MGVYCTDRVSGQVLGLSNRLWALLGESLTALGDPDVGFAFHRDGYVPSWLAQRWGQLLFDGLGDLVMVSRPVPGQPGALRPVGVYRRGTPAEAQWSRRGEQLSAYDLPLAPVFLNYAQWVLTGSGYTTTTLRPVAPGSVLSPVAARTLQERSGLGLSRR